MAATETLTIRIPSKTKRELEEYARAEQRSSAFIIKEILEARLEERRAYLAAIEEGEREADLGVFVSGDAVKRWLLSWGTENVLPRPEPEIFPDSERDQ